MDILNGGEMMITDASLTWWPKIKLYYAIAEHTNCNAGNHSVSTTAATYNSVGDENCQTTDTTKGKKQESWTYSNKKLCVCHSMC